MPTQVAAGIQIISKTEGMSGVPRSVLDQIGTTTA